MNPTKEHVKQLVDALPDAAAAQLEVLLVRLLTQGESDRWDAIASAAFGSWFSDEEYDYSANMPAQRPA